MPAFAVLASYASAAPQLISVVPPVGVASDSPQTTRPDHYIIFNDTLSNDPCSSSSEEDVPTSYFTAHDETQSFIVYVYVCYKSSLDVRKGPRNIKSACQVVS